MEQGPRFRAIGSNRDPGTDPHGLSTSEYPQSDCPSALEIEATRSIAKHVNTALECFEMLQKAAFTPVHPDRGDGGRPLPGRDAQRKILP
jgi:hypothetical protein